MLSDKNKATIANAARKHPEERTAQEQAALAASKRMRHKCANYILIVCWSTKGESS